MRYFGYAILMLGLLGTFGLVKAQEPDIDPKDAVLEKYGNNATLQCIVDDSMDSYKPMKWFKDGKEIISNNKDDDKYIINENNITVKTVLPEDVGDYECVLNLHSGQSYNRTVSLLATPFVYPLAKSKNLVQGDPMHVECQVVGNPEPVLTWYKDQQLLDEQDDERITLTPNKDGISNGTLRIVDLQFEDRAEYMCVAVNVHGMSNSTMLVRVKDKLAALWPFLGICAEVAILVVIIFIYERRRAKKLEELDAKEEADHLTNSHSHKHADDVRQRK